MIGPRFDTTNRSPDDPERTAVEKAIPREMAKERGEERVEEHAELILARARLVDDLR